jgi:hypothetical protein
VMPLEMMKSKMISLDSALKCLIQVKDNTFLCYLIMFKYRFCQDCYNENYFLDTTQSQKQRVSISGQENAAKLNKTGKHHCEL